MAMTNWGLGGGIACMSSLLVILLHRYNGKS
jgi:hypothetical protein